MLRTEIEKEMNSNLRKIMEDTNYIWERDEEFDIYHFYNLYNKDRTVKVIYDDDEDYFTFEKVDDNGIWSDFDIRTNYYPYAINILHHLTSIIELVNITNINKKQ